MKHTHTHKHRGGGRPPGWGGGVARVSPPPTNNERFAPSCQISASDEVVHWTRAKTAWHSLRRHPMPPWSTPSARCLKSVSDVGRFAGLLPPPGTLDQYPMVQGWIGSSQLSFRSEREGGWGGAEAAMRSKPAAGRVVVVFLPRENQ